MRVNPDNYFEYRIPETEFRRNSAQYFYMLTIFIVSARGHPKYADLAPIHSVCCILTAVF